MCSNLIAGGMFFDLIAENQWTCSITRLVICQPAVSLQVLQNAPHFAVF
jgi:hypothetical protein